MSPTVIKHLERIKTKQDIVQNCLFLLSHYHLLDLPQSFSLLRQIHEIFIYQIPKYQIHEVPPLAPKNSPLKWMKKKKKKGQHDCKARPCQAALPNPSIKEMHWAQTSKESCLIVKNQDIKRQSHWHTDHMKAEEGLNNNMKSLPSLVISWSGANQPHKELYGVLQGPGQEMWVDIYFNKTWNDPAIFPSALSVY